MKRVDYPRRRMVASVAVYFEYYRRVVLTRWTDQKHTTKNKKTQQCDRNQREWRGPGQAQGPGLGPGSWSNLPETRDHGPSVDSRQVQSSEKLFISFRKAWQRVLIPHERHLQSRSPALILYTPLQARSASKRPLDELLVLSSPHLRHAFSGKACHQSRYSI